MLMTGIGAFEGLVEAALPTFRRRKAQGKARVGAFKTAMHIAVGCGLIALFIGIDIGFAKKAVSDDIGGCVEVTHYDYLPDRGACAESVLGPVHTIWIVGVAPKKAPIYTQRAHWARRV